MPSTQEHEDALFRAAAELARTSEARTDFAELEKVTSAFPARLKVPPVVLQPDAMAVALLYEKAKALLNDFQAAKS